MNIATIIGIVLGAGVIFADRYLCKIPNGIAILLYVVAVILIVVGRVIGRNMI